MVDRSWTEVRNKLNRRCNNYGSYWVDSRGKEDQSDHISIFFFTELPEEIGAKDLFEIFKEYGLVVVVMIPAKRDKKGRRYGFVRFRKYGDGRLLAIKLDNIFIKGRKLYANIPRFSRGG